jgi:hypothetical protein
MTLDERYPLHPWTEKKEGDRVKTPKFYSDESRGYYYGSVIARTTEGRPTLLVQWDEPVPYWGGYTPATSSILV